MRKLQASAAAAALLVTVSGAALAASQPFEGVVKSVDPDAGTVTFEDGTTFHAAPGVEIDQLDPGTPVTFYYHTYAGQRTVVSYEFGGAGEAGTDLETTLPAAGQ